MAIYQGHRDLRFLINIYPYQFVVLPFDLVAAPLVFTKCMAVVGAFLRKLEVHRPYLDNWFLRGCSRVQVLSSETLVQSTFKALGLLVSSELIILLSVAPINSII